MNDNENNENSVNETNTNNTKKIVRISSVTLFVIVVLIFIFTNDAKAPIPDDSGANVSTTTSGLTSVKFTVKDLKNAMVEVPELETRVRLRDGESDFELVGTPISGYMVMGDVFASTSTFSLATIAVNGGGTGVFEYVILFNEKGGTLSHISSYFIGDRISVVGMNVEGESIKVSYLDRAEDSAMAETPSVPKTKYLKIENNSLVEIQ